jgi:hypothetical protein
MDHANPGLTNILAIARSLESHEDGRYRVTFICPRTLRSEQVVTRSMSMESQRLKRMQPGEFEAVSNLRGILGPLVASVAALFGGRRAARWREVTQEDHDTVLLRAFAQMDPPWKWNAGESRWESGVSHGLGGFDNRYLREAPIVSEVAKILLAHVLVDVARSEGVMNRSKWKILGQFLPGDVGSVDTFMEADRVSQAELLSDASAVQPLTRGTILLLAWGLALADFDVTEPEFETLGSWAESLEVSAENHDLVRRLAQDRFLVKPIAEALRSGCPEEGPRVQTLLEEGRVPQSERERLLGRALSLNAE